MNNLFFDIETIPNDTHDARERIQRDIDAEAAALTAPGNYRDPEKIAAWLAAEREKLAASFEERMRSGGLDGARGRICCIGHARDDAPVRTLIDSDEAYLLRHFFEELRAFGEQRASRRAMPTWVGHNIIGFDLRFLWQRAMVLGISPPALIVPRAPKPWDGTVFDTMLQWAGERGRISLDALCEVFGLPGKDDIDGAPMDGSRVWDLWRQGRTGDIASYCAGDVERTRAIYRRMTFGEDAS